MNASDAEAFLLTQRVPPVILCRVSMESRFTVALQVL